MIVIVREYGYINSVIDKIKSKFPASAIAKVYENTDVSRFKTPPLSFSQWLLITDIKALPSVKKMTNNLIVTQIKTEAELKKVRDVLNGIEYKVVENRKISSTDKVQWVMKSLNCSEDVAKSLTARIHSDSNLVACVNCLSGGYSKYPEDIIKQFVDDRIYPRQMVEFFLGLGGNQGEIRDSMYFYRHAFSWMKSEMEKILNTWLQTFLAYATETLTYANYEMWADEKKFSRFYVKRILDNIGSISLSRILTMQEILRKCKSTEELYYNLIYGGIKC